MTGIEILASVLQSLTIIVLYFIIGFGPGFILGVLLVNRFVADRGKSTRMEEHRTLVKKAIAHNSQWHPSNERWEKHQ